MTDRTQRPWNISHLLQHWVLEYTLSFSSSMLASYFGWDQQGPVTSVHSFSHLIYWSKVLWFCFFNFYLYICIFIHWSCQMSLSVNVHNGDISFLDWYKLGDNYFQYWANMGKPLLWGGYSGVTVLVPVVKIISKEYSTCSTSTRRSIH
jgi:hypothetical protein